MIFIPRAGALDKGDALGRLVVRRPQNLVRRSDRLERAMRSIIMLVMMFGYLPNPEIVDSCGIVGLPAGGPDNGADLQIQGLWLHLQIDGVVFAGLHAPGRILGADDLGRSRHSAPETPFQRADRRPLVLSILKLKALSISV